MRDNGSTVERVSKASAYAESRVREGLQVLGLTSTLEVITHCVAIPELKGALRRCLQEIRAEQRRLTENTIPLAEVTPLPETERMEGKVLNFNAEKGYGFIQLPGQRDVFVHRTAVRGGPVNLEEGQRVRFSTVLGPKGQQAHDVEIL